MKRGFLGLLVVGMIAGSCLAAKWQSYLTAGGLVEQSTVLWNYNFFNPDGAEWLPLPAALGVETELGITAFRTDFYIAYQSYNSLSSIEEKHSAAGTELYHDEYLWKERRFLLGWRHRWNRMKSPALVPLMGAGVSLGRSELKEIRRERIYNLFGDHSTRNYNQRRRSDLNVGVFGELGLIFNANRPMSFMFIGQVYRYDRKFEGDIWPETPDQAIVISTAYRLNLRYQFPVSKHHENL